MPKITKKIITYRLHWFISFIMLSVTTLFTIIPLDGSASLGQNVFAGRIVVQIPMATCSNQYTCEACTLCGCGSWDQLIISPVFGIEPKSVFYACKMPSFLPMGTGQMTVGDTVFGYGPSTTLNVNDLTMTNIWAMAF